MNGLRPVFCGAVVAACLASCGKKAAVEPGSWAAPERVDLGVKEAMASKPRLAFDSQGNAMVLWQNQPGKRPDLVLPPGGANPPDVWANRFEPGRGWGKSAMVGYLGRNGELAVEPATGKALAVWNQGDQAWSRRYKPGLGWAAPQILSGEGGAYGCTQAQIDASGRATAVWCCGRPAEGRLKPGLCARQSIVEGAWGPAAVKEAAIDDASFQLIQTPRGPTGLWNGYRSPVYSCVLSSAGWQIDFAVGGSDQAGQTAAASSGDQTLAAWVYPRNAEQSTVYASRGTGGVWGDYELVGFGSKGAASSPKVAVNAAGDVLVAWSQFRFGRSHRAYASVRPAGGRWKRAEPIDLLGGAAGVDDVAMDGAGNAIVLFTQESSQGSGLFANRYVKGQGWSGPVSLSAARESAVSDAVVAFDPQGGALAVWGEYANGTVLWARRWSASGGVVAPAAAGAAGAPEPEKPVDLNLQGTYLHPGWFSIGYPFASWAYGENGTLGAYHEFVWFYPQGGAPVRFVVAVLNGDYLVGAVPSVAEVAEKYKADMVAKKAPLGEVRVEPLSIDGREARRVSYETLNQQGARARLAYNFFMAGGRQFALITITPSEQAARYQLLFDKMIASFKLIYRAPGEKPVTMGR